MKIGDIVSGGQIRTRALVMQQKTSRPVPFELLSDERMMITLRHKGIEVDELFLTGGIEKKNILDILKPQIFFDDQLGHVEPAAENTPCVHTPSGSETSKIAGSRSSSPA